MKVYSAAKGGQRALYICPIRWWQKQGAQREEHFWTSVIMQEHYSFVCDRNCAFADRYIRRSGRSSIKSWVCPFTCSLHTAKPIRTWNNQTRWHTLESEGNAILSILPVSKKYAWYVVCTPHVCVCMRPCLCARGSVTMFYTGGA